MELKFIYKSGEKMCIDSWKQGFIEGQVSSIKLAVMCFNNNFDTSTSLRILKEKLEELKKELGEIRCPQK